MNTTQQNNILSLDVSARDIPTPPGGGSWTFDEPSWKWISNDEVAVPATAPTGGDAADSIQQEQ